MKYELLYFVRLFCRVRHCMFCCVVVACFFQLEGVADNTIVVVVGDRGHSFGIEFGDHTNTDDSALFEENVRSFVLMSDSSLGKFLQADYVGQELTLEELIKRSQLLVEKPMASVNVSDWQPKGSVTGLGVSPAAISHKVYSLADATPSILHLLGIGPQLSTSLASPTSLLDQIRCASLQRDGFGHVCDC
jgi:hypothetical protein